MTRVHSRTDFQFEVVKGYPRFCRAAYAVIITQSTAYPDERCLYHIETFYGDNGVKLRAEARRYGRAIVTGKRGVERYRDQYLPTIFPYKDLPKRENEVEIR
jgi:hypothetical protein